MTTRDSKLVAFLGKGGTGKTTAAAYVMKHLQSLAVPCAGFDADAPGEKEPGSLYRMSNRLDIGGPVYRAASRTHMRAEALRHTPDGGVGIIDTGAWEKEFGNPCVTALEIADLACVFLKPTGLEYDRVGSILAAAQALDIPEERVLIVVSMADMRTASGRTAATELAEGMNVAGTIPLSNAKDGYANVWDGIHVRPGDAMGLLTERIMKELARG